MNEVTRIHLGRQPFTISLEAHHSLKAYIAAIHKQVHDQAVVDEVELRMAELLLERDVSGEKVILDTDIDFLKQQLGDPKDFSDDVSQEADPEDEKPAKRLFRDTDNAMLAGVAAGLARYFGVDVLLIRVLFVLALLGGGWGVVLYAALWLLVPPAKTPSDRLHMQGKAVTVESLQQLVGRADVKGTASRATSTIAPVIGFVADIIGITTVIVGLAFIFGILAVAIYMALHSGQLFQDSMFPIGVTEHLLVNLSLGLAAIIGLFITLVGLAIVKRRWPVRNWITGSLIGLFLIGVAGCIALSADVVPRVRDRYNADSKTVVRSVEPFQNVKVSSESLDYSYQYSPVYSVTFHYIGDPNIANIKTTVKDGTLTIDAHDYNAQKPCTMLCIFPRYNLTVVVSGPNVPDRPPLPLSDILPAMPPEGIGREPKPGN